MSAPTTGPAPTPTGYGSAPAGAPPSDPRRSPAGRILLGVGLALAILGVGYGALVLVDVGSRSTQTVQESYGAVEQIELVADGEVSVRADDGATSAEVEVVSREGLAAPDYAVVDAADSLVLTNRCDPWDWYSVVCEGELSATVPADTQVTVRTSNGQVLAEGLAGDLDLETSNGRVEVRDAGGDVRARTSNGGVVVDGVDGTVVADTSNGDMDLADVAGNATATTSNGEIEVREVAGNVVAETSNGDVTVVGTDDPVRLEIETSFGEQTVTGAIDDAADRSVSIRTSNGDVAYLEP